MNSLAVPRWKHSFRNCFPVWRQVLRERVRSASALTTPFLGIMIRYGFCLWLNRPDYLAFGPRVQELYDALSSEWETRYEALKDTLPVLSPEKLYLSDLICAAHVLWQEELAEQYPRLTGHGRPIRKENDGPGITSFETYLRGELLTYSVESLRLYAAFVDKSKKERVNLCEQVLRNTVQQYGFSTLEEAESRQP